jgi:parallel beta-helix repeat protein
MKKWLLVIAGLALWASASHALDVNGNTTLTTDLTLQPGESVNINADEITFDCGGHTIVANDRDAIRIVGRHSVEVRNCVIRGAPTRDGIVVEDSNGLSLHLIDIHNGQVGIRFRRSHNSGIWFVNFRYIYGNGIMFTLGSGGNFVHAIDVFRVDDTGVYIEGMHAGNTVQDSTFVDVSNGVYLHDTGHNVITNNLVRNAAVSGVVLDDTSGNAVRDNRIGFTGYWGIALLPRVGPATVINNHLCDNGQNQQMHIGPLENIHPDSTITGNSSLPVCGLATTGAR